MRQDYWQLGTWGRIPVSMHWTVLLNFAWLYIIFQDLLATLIAAPTLFLVMMAHVFGHVATLRRRRIKPTAISLFGLHGEVAFNEYDAKAGDRIAIAWSGVGAQVVVMLLAVAANAFIPFQEIPLALLVWGPMYFIFTKFNILLLIVALLPIGPFDGHDAWKIIPRMRNSMRRPQAAKRAPAPAPEPEPEPVHTPDEQRALDESSQRTAAELIARLSRKSDAPTQDR
jgi:Zn-dependent protease